MKFNVGLNSAMSVAETLANGAMLFLLYAYVNRTLGIGNLGVWSLVVATGSLTRIADMGVGQGLQRKIAVALKTGNQPLAARYVSTGLLAVGAVYAILLLAAFVPAEWALNLSLHSADRALIQELLPITFGSLWISQIAWLTLFGICGTHRVYLKCVISIASNSVNLAGALLLMPHFGLLGLAFAQIAQASAAALLGAIFLKRILPGLKWLPSRGDGAVLRELLAYGWKLQMVAVLVLACEPVTKLLLGGFFGSAEVGLYELASRLVQQVRLLIVAPNNSLVPTFAALGHDEPERCREVLRRAQRITNYVGTAAAAAVVGLLPLIGEVWIGAPNAKFVTIGTLVTIGSFANLYSAPLYYLGIALDRFRWVLTGHMVMVILNGGLCLWMGVQGNANWLIAAASAASITASLIWIFGISAQTEVHLSGLFAKDLLIMPVPAIAAVAASWAIYDAARPNLGLWVTGGIQLAVIGSIWLAILLIHPERDPLLRAVRNIRLVEGAARGPELQANERAKRLS